MDDETQTTDVALTDSQKLDVIIAQNKQILAGMAEAANMFNEMTAAASTNPMLKMLLGRFGH